MKDQLAVKVLETPLPQVNSDWDIPQLPLLELRVKPEPEAMLHHILALRHSKPVDG